MVVGGRLSAAGGSPAHCQLPTGGAAVDAPKAEKHDESTGIGEEDLRQMQSDPPPGRGPGHLHESEA